MAYLILNGGRSGGYFDFDPQSCTSMADIEKMISERTTGGKKVSLLAASSEICDCERKSFFTKLHNFFTNVKTSGTRRLYRSTRTLSATSRNCRTSGRKTDLSVV